MVQAVNIRFIYWTHTIAIINLKIHKNLEIYKRQITRNKGGENKQ